MLPAPIFILEPGEEVDSDDKIWIKERGDEVACPHQPIELSVNGFPTDARGRWSHWRYSLDGFPSATLQQLTTPDSTSRTRPEDAQTQWLEELVQFLLTNFGIEDVSNEVPHNRQTR